MKYSPDAYLLHEANRFITFNIRIKVVMKDTVDPEALKLGAQKAFARFPYYSKQILIDETGGIDLIPNPRTICVHPVSAKRTYLFSKEVNYQPCSIEYEGRDIYFNMYHGMCGGCGTFLWIKTTIYEYICARYGVRPAPGSTIMVDSPISEEEYAFPKLEDIPEDQPLGAYNTDPAWSPDLEYLMGFANLVFSDSVHYEFDIPKNDLMRYVSANDGSPLSAVAAIMVKAMYRVLQKNQIHLRVKSNHNYRAAVGCPKTHQDLLTPIFCLLPYHTRDWPIDKLCTIIRGSTHLQSQPEYAYETLRRFYTYTEGVDNVEGLKNKNKYATKNSHRVFNVKSSLLINYTGKEDWGGMTEYVERAYGITDAHLLIEIFDVGDNFCISLMQMTRTKKYMNSFFEILEEEKIPYKIHGVFKNHLPISKVASAPIIETTENK